MIENYSLISVSSGWGATNTGTARGPEIFLNSIDPVLTSSTFQSPQQFSNYFHHKIHIQPQEQPFVDFYPLTGVQLENRQKETLLVCQKLYDACMQELTKNQKLFVFGGDQSISIGTWSAVADSVEGPLGLIWIDAHLDAHTSETSPSQACHGMAAAVLLGYGENALTHMGRRLPKIHPDRLVYIGARSFEEGEYGLLKKLGVKIYGMDDIHERGFGTIFEEARQQVSRNNCSYGITFDVDAIDPLEVPGTGAPAPNGIHGSDVLTSLRGLCIDEKLITFECVEFNPQLDKDDMTLKFIWQLFHAIMEKP